MMNCWQKIRGKYAQKIKPCTFLYCVYFWLVQYTGFIVYDVWYIIVSSREKFSEVFVNSLEIVLVFLVFWYHAALVETYQKVLVGLNSIPVNIISIEISWIVSFKWLWTLHNYYHKFIQVQLIMCCWLGQFNPRYIHSLLINNN